LQIRRKEKMRKKTVLPVYFFALVLALVLAGIPITVVSPSVEQFSLSVEPIDLAVTDISNVTQLLINAHTNPPLINDKEPIIKMVTGIYPGSDPIICIDVHWKRVDNNNNILAFFAFLELNITRGTIKHVVGNETFVVGAPGDEGTTTFRLNLTGGTADDYAGKWTFSAYINVADSSVYDTNLANNIITDKWACVLGTGDVFWYDHLGLVDIGDLVAMVDAIPSVPGATNWNWYADIVRENSLLIDISDLVVLISLIPHSYTPDC